MRRHFQKSSKGWQVNEVIEIERDKTQDRRVNQNGQRIGAKGQRTRQRLIDVTVDLLRTHGLRDLTVAEVARVAETSPATFYVYFDGVPEVVLSALENSSQTSPRLLELVDEDHRRILEGVARRMGLDEHKVITTVTQHGNTSAASVPLAFEVARQDGRIQQGDLVLLEAMGGGFTWGASLIRL